MTSRQARIADNNLVWRWLELSRVETLESVDAGLAKLVGHRWVDGAVAAADLKPQLLCQLRKAPHERAADAEKIEVFAHEGAPK